MGQLTGETQLRARRTRVKILRAIADRNGVAGFSDIKVSTGLSTGSIYYHIDRMGDYVTKDAKQYLITEEGLQFLREADPKYTSLDLSKKEDPFSQKKSGSSEETVRQPRYSIRQYMPAFATVIVFAIAAIGAFSGFRIFPVLAGINPGVGIVMITSAALLATFVVLARRSFPVIGYKGTIVSVLAIGILLANIMIFSGLQFTYPAGQSYDNSMDALLSSYSMHWQVR